MPLVESCCQNRLHTHTHTTFLLASRTGVNLAGRSWVNLSLCKRIEHRHAPLQRTTRTCVETYWQARHTGTTPTAAGVCVTCQQQQTTHQGAVAHAKSVTHQHGCVSVCPYHNHLQVCQCLRHWVNPLQVHLYASTVCSRHPTGVRSHFSKTCPSTTSMRPSPQPSTLQAPQKHARQRSHDQEKGESYENQVAHLRHGPLSKPASTLETWKAVGVLE